VYLVITQPSSAAYDNFRKLFPPVFSHKEPEMKKSLVLATLVAAAALSACGKKEEPAPAPAPAPAAAPAPAPAASAAADAASAAASGAAAAASSASDAASAAASAASK
jgi:hypothetical protein